MVRGKQFDIMSPANGLLGRKVSSETSLLPTSPTYPHGLTSIVLQLLANGLHRFTLLMLKTILQPAAT